MGGGPLIWRTAMIEPGSQIAFRDDEVGDVLYGHVLARSPGGFLTIAWNEGGKHTVHEDDCRVSMGVSQPTGNPLSEGLNERDTVAVPKDMPERFADWLDREMPPHTIIADARWWAPRIWRAMIYDKYR